MLFTITTTVITPPYISRIIFWSTKMFPQMLSVPGLKLFSWPKFGFIDNFCISVHHHELLFLLVLLLHHQHPHPYPPVHASHKSSKLTKIPGQSWRPLSQLVFPRRLSLSLSLFLSFYTCRRCVTYTWILHTTVIFVFLLENCLPIAFLISMCFFHVCVRVWRKKNEKLKN